MSYLTRDTATRVHSTTAKADREMSAVVSAHTLVTAVRPGTCIMLSEQCCYVEANDTRPTPLAAHARAYERHICDSPGAVQIFSPCLSLSQRSGHLESSHIGLS